MAIASGEELGPSYVAKRSLVSITNASPGWTRRTGGLRALKLVQSWSLVLLFMLISPLLSALFRQVWHYRRRSYLPTWDRNPRNLRTDTTHGRPGRKIQRRPVSISP